MKKILPILFCILFVSCGSHLYDGVITYDNYGLIQCNKDYVSEEALTDTYFNYFKDSNLDYLIIQYNDDLNYGVYMSDSMILENARLTTNESGDYMLGDDSEAIMYAPKDNKLIKQ